MKLYQRMPNCDVTERDIFTLVDDFGFIVENIVSMEDLGDNSYIFETWETQPADADDDSKGHIDTTDKLYLHEVEVIWVEQDELLPADEGFEEQETAKVIRQMVELVIEDMLEVEELLEGDSEVEVIKSTEEVIVLVDPSMSAMRDLMDGIQRQVRESLKLPV